MRFSRVTVLAAIVAVLLLPALAVQASQTVLNHFGYLYETGGFPASNAGDVLTGVGLVTNAGMINCDISSNELTWVIENLVSGGQTSPDGGRTLIVNYTGGEISLYCDAASNADFGTNPPNSTATSTFEDGSLILVGGFTQFVLFYDTLFKVGAYQGVISFTNGPGLDDLPDPNGLVFAGTIGPELDPNIPDGYDLEGVGQIVAPILCTVKGNVEFWNEDATAGGPVEGVTVDIVDDEGNIFSQLTDANGDYCFLDVAGPEVQVSIVVPLGYTPDTPTAVGLTCEGADTAYADFHLTQHESTGDARTIGFWKHQVNKALQGNTNGVHYTGAEMLALLAEAHAHFDPFFALFPDANTLQNLQDLFELDPNFSTNSQMFDNARRHFMALMLNVVSGKLHTLDVISDDGATVSQAITYVAQLLTDADDSNDELAKDIADTIVNGKSVDAGIIPLSIAHIAYSPGIGDEVTNPGSRIPGLVQSFGNYPNPFNPNTTISYELDSPAVVTVVVYDVRGKQVRELADGRARRGINTVVWDGRDDSGRAVASGIYFTHLSAGGERFTKRMVLIR